MDTRKVRKIVSTILLLAMLVGLAVFLIRRRFYGDTNLTIGLVTAGLALVGLALNPRER